MRRSTALSLVLVLSATLVAGLAEARNLGVEVWTDRGNEAVYQPGDVMHVKARVSDDAYLLVYEIDTEGYVRVLHPFEGRPSFVEGRRTLFVPPPSSDVDLVVQNTVGESYIVAIASETPFRSMPWYLRPYSAQAEALGYVGEPDEEEGITSEGRIVGDPFVAMERIRRRVLSDGDDDNSFATAYTTYYVHHEVRYPRYLCYDCHRPNRWAWWDGFDPYYTSCSVFSFRVNWSWAWGPSYWFGTVPYYVYVYRPDCPPRYSRWYQSGVWYSSWDGWNRWNEMWGNGGLRRYKSPPPAGYVPPARWKDHVGRMPASRPLTDRTPPGFLVTNREARLRDGVNPRLPIGRSREGRDENASGRTIRGSGGIDRPGVLRDPAARTPRDDSGFERTPRSERRGEARPTPVYRPREEGRPVPSEPRIREPEPRRESRPESRPAPTPSSPRVERPREERPAPAPRIEPQRPDPPRHEDRSPRAPESGKRDKR